MDGRELGQSVDNRAPAEIVNDQALHACCAGGVDDGVWMSLADARPAYHADGRVLPGQGLGQLFEGVVCLDDGDFGWECPCVG